MAKSRVPTEYKVENIIPELSDEEREKRQLAAAKVICKVAKEYKQSIKEKSN